MCMTDLHRNLYHTFDHIEKFLISLRIQSSLDVSLCRHTNDTSNSFSIAVGDTQSEFSFNFKVENIKILPGTYRVDVSQKLLSRSTCQNYALKYYIALEPDSTFG